MKSNQRGREAFRRKTAVMSAVALAVTLAGCSGGDAPQNRRVAPGFSSAPTPYMAMPARTNSSGGASLETGGAAANGKYAYAHDLWLTVGSRFVKAHFEAAKEACATDATLKCVLIEASVSLNDAGAARPSAHLRARLPHESVARFKSLAVAPAQGERPSDVVVQRSSTQLEELGQPLADTKRRREQLEDYRTRLKIVEARPDSRVEDLIRIAEELSRVQSQIEELDEQHRKLEERAETEIVSVAIQSEAPPGGALAPLEEVWRQSANILGANAAEAFRFVLFVIPWTPVILLGVLLVRWTARAWRRRATNV